MGRRVRSTIDAEGARFHDRLALDALMGCISRCLCDHHRELDDLLHLGLPPRPAGGEQPMVPFHYRYSHPVRRRSFQYLSGEAAAGNRRSHAVNTSGGLGGRDDYALGDVAAWQSGQCHFHLLQSSGMAKRWRGIPHRRHHSLGQCDWV